MNDAQVSFELSEPGLDTRLTQAIDAFTRWRADLGDANIDADAPGLIVKTGFSTDGALSKTLIFEEPRWAEFFINILLQQSAA